MNSLIETLNLWGGRIPNFALPMLWQSSLLIMVLFAFDLAARRKVRASVRYALWLVLLVKLLLPPTLALPTSVAWWVRPPATSPKPEARATAFVVTYGDFVPAGFSTPAPLVVGPPPKPSLSSGGWAAAMWAVVGAGLLAWLCARWRRVSSDVRRATVVPESLTEVLSEAQCCITLPRRVRLLVTKRAMSPAVCGLFRPVILLPQSLMERLTPSQLCAVLLHELVHLRRGDVWVNCLQALLQILYWWHPLLWLANARIRRVREEAVDDSVMLALRDDAETYAPTLVEVAKLALNRPLASLGLVGIMESRSALGQRIERLVGFHPPRKAGLTIASAFCILAFAALAVPMEQAPPTSATQDSTQKQTDEEVKLRMIVLNKPVAGDAAQIRKLADGIIAKVKGGAAFSDMASVFSEDRQRRPGGDWGWVQKYDRDGALLLRTELADVAFSLKPGEMSGVIETPEAIYLMKVEDKRPARIKALSVTTSAIPVSSNSVPSKTNVTEFVQHGRLLLEEGKLDEAENELKKAIAVAPQNRAAFYYLNLVKEARYNDAELRREQDSTTSRVKIESTAAKREALHVPNPYPVVTGKGRQAIISKLDQIRLDFVFFDDTTLEEVVLWLKDEARTRDPESKGINLIINPNAVSPVQQVDPTTGLPVGAPQPTEIKSLRITINPTLTDVRLADVLDAIVNAADKRIKYSIEDYAVVFSTKAAQEAEPLVTRTFKLEPNTLERVTGIRLGIQDSGIPQIRVDATNQPSGLRLVTRTNAMQPVSLAVATFFSSLGVDLASPAAIALGKSIFWSHGKSMLLVRATKDDLDIIERALADSAAKPTTTTNLIATPTTIATNNPAESTNGLSQSRREALTNKVPVLGDLPLLDKLFRSDSARATNGSFGNALPKSLYESTPGPRIRPDLYFQVELREDGSYWAGGKRMNLEELRDWLVKTTQSNQRGTGRITRVKGVARYSTNNNIWQPLVVGTVLRAGAVVQTTKDSYLPAADSSIGFQVHSNAPPEAVRAVAEMRKEFGTLAGSASALPALPSPEQLQIREFKVDPDIFYKGLESVTPPHATRTNVSVAAVTFFSSLGVDLASPSAIALGKAVFWSAGKGTLLIRATKLDLDLIEAAIVVLNRVPPQINIQTHFVEIDQAETPALGWDWYLGDILLSKGAVTNSVSILTDPQFRVVLRALEQRKGADVLAAPSVTTVSGRQAQIQVVNMQTVVTGINTQALVLAGTNATNGYAPAVFQTQVMPFGPTLDVVPYVAPDGYKIQMTVIPTVTEFLGYDGSPTYWPSNSIGLPTQPVLPLPHFRTRQMMVTAIIRDGQTLVLANPTVTETFKKPDGSTETKDVSGTQKKQLIVFVTPTLVDAAGNRIHSDDKTPGTK